MKRWWPFALGMLIVATGVGPPAAEVAAGQVGTEGLARILADLPPEAIPSGILYDRVLPLSRIEVFDGRADSPVATAGDWRQIYDEIRRASLVPSAWPQLEEIYRRASETIGRGIVPIAVMAVRYERLRPEAWTEGRFLTRDGRLISTTANPCASQSLLCAAPLRDYTYQGAEVIFRLDAEDVFTNDGTPPRQVEIDFDDGRGPQRLLLGRAHQVCYTRTGAKTIRLRLAERGAREARFRFDVRALHTPAPDETLQIQATIPYQGAFATGEAYVYLSDQHTTLTEPVCLLEGFDLENSMGWEELYALLNREELIETLRSDGFDAVVLDFTDATDYIQRNAMVAIELIEQIQAAVGPAKTLALAGASMGGLVGRYALAYMEANGREHAVRTFISFDSPQTGADIPLGLQYWLWFFAAESPDAAALLAALDSPAARQLLIYHYTDPPGATGQSDPLRAELEADLAALGGYPQEPRRVAVANGSGAQADQGFDAGDQIIRWEYTSFLLDVTGNVWAVPDGTSQLIFHGLINPILLPADEVQVTVSGTEPLDNAPGGWRGSMAQLDTTAAPYGDIEALHPQHCFIPAISALALDTGDLFYDIAGDPNLLALSPFDALYFPLAFPLENQEHVEITPENAVWLRAEIEQGATSGVPEGPGGIGPVARIAVAAPSVAGEATRVRFTIPVAGQAHLAVYDAAGREITRLADRHFAVGEHETTWRGIDRHGARVGPGVYFLLLRGEGFAAARKMIRCTP